MTAHAIVYGNAAAPDGVTGWRAIAVSGGMSADMVSSYRAACDRFAQEREKDAGAVMLWGVQDRNATMLICTERRKTDAFGRPNGWLFYGIVCRNDRVPLRELVLGSRAYFANRDQWLVGAGVSLDRVELMPQPPGDVDPKSLTGESESELRAIASAVADAPPPRVSFILPLKCNDTSFSVVGLQETNRITVRRNMAPSSMAPRIRTVLAPFLFVGILLLGGTAVWCCKQRMELRQELNGTQQELTQLQDDLTTARDVCVSLQQERDHARQEATEAEARNRKLTREKEGLREELAALEEQIRQGDSNEARKQMMERQSKDLEKAKEDLAGFERRMVNIHRLSSSSEPEPEPKPHWTGRLLPSNRP
ncbi:MAG: hypothetical protein HN742_10790 [Lentisphaerae bacterium]|jgi:hypothetical protein|nr:hypothetical protein [Lentisphaerota bacterium]MBT4816025.1 hypothetical protein [Lentisphaerota bacterium]MBT5608914.1 hypothetical protein [Lentisphaerota bacterium]MBT7053506.1 hypothetical protein [Lentisphaerota bacterium]MBT7842350.1 hypothetical protein [Lentisphaerota bacterium]